MTEQMTQPPLVGLVELDAEPRSQQIEGSKLQETLVAVNLRERVLALKAIMAYYNQASRVDGINQVKDTSRSDFRQRYGERSNQVFQGAKDKRNELREGFQQGIETLAASKAMAANGDEAADIDIVYRSVQHQLNRELGVGSKATAKDRKEVIERADHANDTQNTLF